MHVPIGICLLVALLFVGAIVQDCQIFKRVKDSQVVVQQRSTGQIIGLCVVALIAVVFVVMSLKMFFAS